MNPSTFSMVFATALCTMLLFKLALASRQIRHVAQHRDVVPPEFAHSVPLTTHQRAADYTIAKARLDMLSGAWGAAVLVGWTLLGGADLLNVTLQETLLPNWGWMGYQLALLASFFALSSVLEAPIGLYQTFWLEQHFGFNRITWRLLLADTLKGAAVAVVLGLPLAALVLWLMAATGSMWWLWTWAAWVAFGVLMMLIYPLFIAPLFNRFEPLKDELVQSRVNALMARCGFSSQGLFVMDGSKHSAHGNAYFTGLGAAKRVVFFDTLLHKLTPAEIEAVLAHELGHFKHRHALKRMLVMFALSFATLAGVAWLAAQSWFYQGLGVEPSLSTPNHALALLLLMLSLPVVSYFVAPLWAQWSRKDEFEADAYACAQTNAADLGSALLKLCEDNASTLTPDPLFAMFYYSHPPARERMAAMGTTSLQLQ